MTQRVKILIGWSATLRRNTDPLFRRVGLALDEG